MPQDIEIKARVADIKALRAKVAAIADRGPIEIGQDDTFFACEAGRLKLRTSAAGEGELIFYRRNNQSGIVAFGSASDPLRWPQLRKSCGPQRGNPASAFDVRAWRLP